MLLMKLSITIVMEIYIIVKHDESFARIKMIGKVLNMGLKYRLYIPQNGFSI
jgi:hypothetical protein